MTSNDISSADWRIIDDDYRNFRQKFTEIHQQIPKASEKANVLWMVGSATPSLLKSLPYLLTMNVINKSNEMLLLIPDLHDYLDGLDNELHEDTAKLTATYEIYRRFDIGTIIKFDEICYTKNYQRSLFQLSRLVNVRQAMESVQTSMQKSITELDTFNASDLMLILLIANTILYFDVSHVLIDEQQTSMYRFIQCVLLDKYGRTLTLLPIPMIPISVSSLSVTEPVPLNARRDQILHELARLDHVEQTTIRSYFQAMIDEFYNEETSLPNRSAFDFSIVDIRDHILLSSHSKEDAPIYIAASFLTDQFHVLKKHWRKNVNKDETCTGTGKGIDGLQANQKGFEPLLGGKFVIINWSTKEIVYTLDLDAPAGFFIEDNYLYVANNRLHYISIIDLTTRQEIKRLTNSAFNCLHSMQRAEDETIVIASTGIDAILQINAHGETIHAWYATEHGYAVTPKGETRVVERDFAHDQYIYPTLHQTTHLNTAQVFDADYYLATLFHQGALIKVHRRTGECETLLSGLRCPHAIKRYSCVEVPEVAWLLCNTKQNELLFLNDTFQIAQRMLFEDVSWLQDASPLSNGHLLIGDANHSRIVAFDPKSNSVVDEFEYSADWRIYQFNDLSDFQTNFTPHLR